MAMTPVPLFSIQGNPSINISQDEWRSLLGKIEAELHSSQVYQGAMATLQKLLGASGEPIKILFKAVGREAISLAFQQFVQPEKLTETDNVLPSVETATSDSSSIKIAVPTSSTHITEEKEAPKLTVNSPEKLEIKPSSAEIMKWFKPNKKPNPAELAQQIAVEQRIKIICKIGQELKQAREDRGLSLCQLNIYTHVPIHHMEAIENCRLELLPEDTLVRGFIRAMGNAVGLNGTNLAATLPATDTVQSILPSWYNSPKSSAKLGMDIRPVHLYIGYTALVAGAVGGLTLTSQQANTGRTLNPYMINSPSSSVCKSSQKPDVCVKPGLNSSSFGTDIAPPETF